MDGPDTMTDWPQPYAPQTYLHCFPVSGNIYDAVRAVNNLGWSDFLVQVDAGTNNSIALLRMPIDWPRDGRGPLPASKVNRP